MVGPINVAKVHVPLHTVSNNDTGTDLEIKLRERGITEVHLIGVCTDICVLHTAVDAYNKGFSIVVHQDAVASFDQAGHEWALRHFKNTLGANVV